MKLKKKIWRVTIQTFGMTYPWHFVSFSATWGIVTGATTPSLWISWSVASVYDNLYYVEFKDQLLNKNKNNKDQLKKKSKNGCDNDIYVSLLKDEGGFDSFIWWNYLPLSARDGALPCRISSISSWTFSWIFGWNIIKSRENPSVWLVVSDPATKMSKMVANNCSSAWH